MKGLQQGRASVSKRFKTPKDFKKAEKMYREVFDQPNKTAAEAKNWAPKYSRVTHKALKK